MEDRSEWEDRGKWVGKDKSVEQGVWRTRMIGTRVGGARVSGWAGCGTCA